MGKSLLVRACCAFYASFKEFISLVDDNDDNAHCDGDADGSDEYGSNVPSVVMMMEMMNMDDCFFGVITSVITMG